MPPEVSKAFSSAHSCSASTVTALQALLEWTENSALNLRKNDDKFKTNPSRTGTARSARPAIKSNDRAKQQKLEVLEHDNIRLSDHEKLVLATEVINISLRNLGEALKSQAAESRNSPGRGLNGHAAPNEVQNVPSQSCGRSLSGTTPDSSSPLQPLPVRKALNKPKNMPKAAQPCVRRSSTDSGIIATADCARLSLAYLRSRQADKALWKDSPPMQLEEATQALIGRLIAHGLETLAIEELKILKPRLLAHIGDSQARKNANGNTNRAKGSMTERAALATLFAFPRLEAQGSMLLSIVNYQISILKAALIRRHPEVIEALYEHLQDIPCSPPGLLVAYADETGDKEKAANRLATFSQALLSCCPSTSKSEDAIACNAQVHARPETIFRLQHLALSTRVRWWVLSGHKINLDEGLLSPFAKYLAAFHRRSQLPATQKYELAVELWQSLRRLLDTEGLTGGDFLSFSGLADTYKTLGAIAQAAHLSEAALTWIEGLWSLYKRVSASEARIAGCRVRIAVIQLESVSSGLVNHKVEETVREALQALRGNIRGQAADLDALLGDVTTLCKTAMKLAVNQPPSTSLTLELSASSPITLCCSIVNACTHFLLKYIGISHPDTPSAQNSLQSSDRRDRAVRVAPSFIDSVVFCSRAWIEAGNVRYDTLDAALRDCCTILSRLSEVDSATGMSNSESLFLKISNIYWSCSSLLKKQEELPAQVYINCLCRAIDIIRDCTPQIQEWGSLAAKLERLGHAYESAGQPIQSRHAFQQTIDVLFSTGALSALRESASRSSLQEAFESSEAAKTVGRNLTAFNKVSINAYELNKELPLFYDDEALALPERGILLEWQLDYLSRKAVGLSHGHDLMHSAAETITRTLFELYSEQEFPLRHRRVAVHLLRLAGESTHNLDERLLAIAIARNRKCGHLAQDVELHRFQDHLAAIMGIYDAFRQTPPAIETLKRSLFQLQRIVDEVRTGSQLSRRVDNIPALIAQLNLISEFLDMQGLDQLRLPTINLISRILDLQDGPDVPLRVETMSNLGLQYLRLGYSGKAGLVLARARSLLKHPNVTAEAQIHWNMSYAEYLGSIGHKEKSFASLTSAEEVASTVRDLTASSALRAAMSGRIKSSVILANAFLTYSSLYLEHDSPESALKYAKISVALIQQAWSILEKRVKTGTTKAEIGNPEADPDAPGLDNGRASAKTTSNAKGPDLAVLNGAQFWSIIPSLFRGLCLLSKILALQGLFQEALHYVQRARSIADAVQAKHLIVRASCLMARYWAQSGKIETAKEYVDKATPHAKGLETSMDVVTYHSCVAQVHGMEGSWEEERQAHHRAALVLEELTLPQWISSTDKFGTTEVDVTGLMAGLRLDPVPATRKTVRATRTAKTAPKKPPMPKLKSAPGRSEEMKARNPAEECAPLVAMRKELLWSQAVSVLSRGEIAAASQLLEIAGGLLGSRSSEIHQQVLTHQTLALQGLQAMAADFTYNVLPESTISFPAVSALEGQMPEPLPATNKAPISGKSDSTARLPPRKTKRTKEMIREDFAATLRKARDGLREVQSAAIHSCSTSLISQLCNHLSQLTILLSVMTPDATPNIKPLFTSFSMELPKTLAFHREQCSIQSDNLRATETRWPVFAGETTDSHALTAKEFQKDFIDIIPHSWSTISISLSDTHDELYLTRYYPGQNPFILRLPLARQNSRDMDEDVFGFDEGKAELLDIIAKSNATLRGSIDMSVKGAKTAWWAEREALDSRLRGLLVNIENIWLGGFRGIFSQPTRQPDLLSRFQKSFEDILNRHLPSRRGARGHLKQVNFDPRIFELFVGLGNPGGDGVDLDEPLADLLYFVVDILQFNGERNAYDEIDFDSMTIETTDALRSYHDTAAATTTSKHTILVLDKRLHAFPWECLPCLSGVSVSRLPSLAALRSRILKVKASESDQQSGCGREGHYISKAAGTVILNPSGDLRHTQEVFEPAAAAFLNGWTKIIGQKPSGSQFSSALTNEALLLYFGHGSGAQYVSQRSIKRLDKCAVSWLMGCSSGAIVENGEYEPDGTVLAHLVAGAPAVVAMLWDVTDKDCDRFALKCGEEWGLWDGVSHLAEPPKTSKRGSKKGKERARTDRAPSSDDGAAHVSGNPDPTKLAGNARRTEEGASRSQQSLVEAVARSRDACYLRYLNGAAPVVYGIPVFLSERC